MTSKSPLSASLRKPRQRPAPSQRDQQIYLDYQTSGLHQSDLAEKYGLTQCRISQIVRRVERWLQDSDQTTCDEAGSGDAAARQELKNRLESERLNSVARHAMQHFQQQQKTVTHKKGSRGGKDIDETTERTLPPNIQCLKVVLQASRQLNQLEKKSGTGVSPVRGVTAGRAPSVEADGRSSATRLDRSTAAQQTSDHGREQVEDWLTEQRDEVERVGLAPCSFGSRPLVRDLVSTLLGQCNKGVALSELAQQCGKKIVDRKSYDDNPPKLPPGADGWYYPLYDYHGGLVAWLSADQLAAAIHPDYKPVRAPTTGTPVSADPQPAPAASSTTSPPASDSAEVPSSPALTTPSPHSPFPAVTLNDPALSGVIDGASNCGVV